MLNWSSAGLFRSPSRLQIRALILVLITLAPLVIGFIRYIGVVREAIAFPYALDFGEGVVWVQLREIAAGRGYGPIDRFPSFVFHYPPVYHLLTAWTASAFDMDELVAGRLISVLATLGMAVVVGLTTTLMAKTDGAGRLSSACGMVAGLLVLSMMPVLHWSRLMRVDMLALLFSFAGLYWGLRALQQPRTIHLAAVCFVAAVFTKQTSIAPAIAVLGTLLFLHPRTALAGIGSGLILALAALALTLARFGTGFVDHIILYNMNTIDWSHVHWIVTMLSQHALFIFVAVFALLSGLRDVLLDRRGRAAVIEGAQALALQVRTGQLLILLVYLLVATVMLLTIIKAGATYNYFMEWLCIIALLAGLGMRDIGLLVLGADGAKASALPMLIPAALAMQSIMLPDTAQDSWRMTAARRADMDKFAATIARARKPVISNDLALLIRAGKDPRWEPFTFPELATKGLWNEQPFLERLRRQEFAFFVTDGDDPGTIAGSYGSIAPAIVSAYPVTRHVGGMTISLPRQATPRKDSH
jgi:hypothetical protein